MVCYGDSKIYNNSKQLKLDLGIPENLANRFGYHITSAAEDLNRVYERGIPVSQVIEDRYNSDDKKEDIEAYRKFLEDPPKSMLALVDLMYNAPTGQNLEPGDIIFDHFGKTIDGRPVLIDYGFTTDVAEGYYWSSSDDPYGSPPPSSIMSDEESLPRASGEQLEAGRLPSNFREARSPRRS